MCTVLWLLVLLMLWRTRSRSSWVSLILHCSIISFCSYCCLSVCKRRWLFSSSSISFCLMAISQVMLARSAWKFSVGQRWAKHSTEFWQWYTNHKTVYFALVLKCASPVHIFDYLKNIFLSSHSLFYFCFLKFARWQLTIVRKQKCLHL